MFSVPLRRPARRRRATRAHRDGRRAGGRCDAPRSPAARSARPRPTGRECGDERRAAVAIAFDAPSHAQHRRSAGRDELGELLDVGFAQAALRRRRGDAPLASPRRGTRRRRRRAPHRTCRRSGPARAGGWPRRRRARRRCRDEGQGARRRASAIPVRRGSITTSARTALPRLRGERQQMRVGDGRVGAPDDEQLGVRHVERIGREHVAEDLSPRRAGGAGTDRVLDLGQPEAVHDARAERTRAEHAGRRAVEVRDHRRRAVLADGARGCARRRGRGPRPTGPHGTRLPPSDRCARAAS